MNKLILNWLMSFRFKSLTWFCPNHCTLGLKLLPYPKCAVFSLYYDGKLQRTNVWNENVKLSKKDKVKLLCLFTIFRVLYLIPNNIKREFKYGIFAKAYNRIKYGKEYLPF
jgi:hypothetical protein